jgi:hypothetical protein
MKTRRIQVAAVVCTVFLWVGIDAGAEGILSVDGSRMGLRYEGESHVLTIENMGLGDEAALGAAWTHDLTTGAWVSKTAGIENSQDLVSIPDSGIRADYASNPGARVDPVTGTVYLYYEFRNSAPPSNEQPISGPHVRGFLDCLPNAVIESCQRTKGVEKSPR